MVKLTSAVCELCCARNTGVFTFHLSHTTSSHLSFVPYRLRVTGRWCVYQWLMLRLAHASLPTDASGVPHRWIFVDGVLPRCFS
jgi:hypothetical protein